MLLAAVAVFGFANVNAQEVKFGAKAGVNIANIGGDDTDGQKARTAFHVGGVAEIGISDKFAVQPELLYSSQGTKADQGDGEVKLDYLNIPVMAKYMVADGFSLEAGPQVGVLLSAKSNDGEGSGDVDIKDFVNGIDFALGVGANYTLESGLNFGARYSLGLSDINDFEGAGSNQNNVFQFSVGYFFN